MTKGSINPKLRSTELFNLHGLDRAGIAFHIGLHVMVLTLSLIAVFIDGLSWSALVFLLFYSAGMVLLRKQPTLVISLLWIIGVIVIWGWFTKQNPTAVYIVFALFFLVMSLFSVGVGAILVLVLLSGAIALIATDMGWTLGGVLGPLITAVVAMALSLGVDLLRRESAAREEASLIAGEMEERTRLAAEIHDTVAQGLSSIIMLMQSVELRIRPLSYGNGEDREGQQGRELEEIQHQIKLARKTAQDNLSEIRRIISKLQANPLQGANLAVALAGVVDGTPLGESLEFEVDGTPTEIPQNIEHELLRATQSLVSNVVRHSQAESARVTLSYLPDSIAVDVVDNGIGIEEEALTALLEDPADSAIGLAGVRRRIHRLGGQFSIESDVGLGTGVSIQVPVRSKKSEKGAVKK